MNLAFTDRQGLGTRKREGGHSRQQEAEISVCMETVTQCSWTEGRLKVSASCSPGPC